MVKKKWRAVWILALKHVPWIDMHLLNEKNEFVYHELLNGTTLLLLKIRFGLSVKAN